jgi:membrane protease subunit HflC
MQTERQREAAEIRAQGRSLGIRARADRNVTVLFADARQHGEQARGDGDADRARIFAQAYRKDLEILRVLSLDAGI